VCGGRADFEEVDGDNDTEMSHSHREEELSNEEEFMTLDEEETREASESSPDGAQRARTLSIKDLADIFKHLNDISAILDENNPDHQTRFKVIREANHAFSWIQNFIMRRGRC
jgi:hypothetical protein